MEQLNPCPSGVAGCTATLHERMMQIRRGTRGLEVPRAYWRCSSECQDPLTGGPLEVVDASLAARNEELVRLGWWNRFGEELPVPLPPGRRPGKTREQRVTILLTDNEVADLDRLRGQRSRSEFIRETMLGPRAR